MPCTKIIIEGPANGKIDELEFIKDHENEIGIAKIEVSGPEWVPVKFYWASGITEVISIEPGVDQIGHEAAYGVDKICVEIDGHPETRICARPTSYEAYMIFGAAALIMILLLKK